MWLQLDRFSAALLDATVGAVVLTASIALAMVFQHQPARRRTVARAGMAGVLVLLPLALVAPIPRLNLLGLPRLIVPEAWVTWDWTLIEAQASDALSLFSRVPWLGRGLALVYLVVGVLGVSGVVLGYLGSRWLIGRAANPSPATLERYREIVSKIGGRAPKLLVSKRIRRPVLVGLGSPVILIPEEFDQADSRDPLVLSLLHELAHDVGRDPSFSLIASLARSAWFFLPTTWWIARQMRLDQEYIADLRATGHFGPPDRYALSLLEIAGETSNQDWSRAGQPLQETVPASNQDTNTSWSDLYQRMLMILKCPFSVEPHPPFAWSLLVSLGVALLTLSASALTVQGNSPARSIRQAGPRVNDQSIKIANLIVTRGQPYRPGRPLLCRLPVPLPPSFRLKMEIWANDVSLSGTKLAGFTLRPGQLGPRMQDPLGWHSIEIRKGPRNLEIEVDRDKVVHREAEGVPELRWLVVETSSQPSIKLRKIELTW